MKKLVSLLAAAGISAAMLMPVNTFADDVYTPLCYFTVNPDANVKILSGDTVCVSKKALESGDITLDANVRIEDKEQQTYVISAKWRSTSDYIILENPVDASVSTGTVKEYVTKDGKKFTTDLTPFCYSTITSDNTMKIPYDVTPVYKPELNSIYLTCYRSFIMYPSPLEVLGSSTDEYPFASFDIVIDSETPEGEYDVIFSTKNNTSGANDVLSHGGTVVNSKETRDFVPRTRDLKIIVADYDLGDVNQDGAIDALDASEVLMAYADHATGKDYRITTSQQLAADVNNDNAIDALDASHILGYYAFIATGGSGSMTEYMAAQK